MPQVNRIQNTQQALAKKGVFSIDYLGVAGGGGSASGSLANPEIGAGGGGAGGVITGSFVPERDTVYTIVVGDGGAPLTNGENTTLFSSTALGGGFGVQSGFTGSNGGSGGGGSVGGSALQPTASYKGFGNDGGGEIQDLEIEFLAIGGGGGGNQQKTSPGDSPTYGYGGGAGGVITGSFTVEKRTFYEFIVGSGGAPNNGGVSTRGQNGTDTVVFNNVALGGGGGGTATGGSGGSGGGGTVGGTGLQPTATYVGFGNDGGSSSTGSGGGGAGTPGINKDGGDGVLLDFTGTSLRYAAGGAGNNFNDLGTGGTADFSYGNGGAGGFSSPAGTFTPRDATSGSAGVIIIKYAGEEIKAEGGTITQSGGYTYHTFTSATTSSFYSLGSGGGGGGAATSGSTFGGNGGDGILLDIYSTPIKYGPGGAGWSVSGSGDPGSGSFGAGGNAGITPQSGSAGVAIVRYRGIPKATGGTVTTDDRYTYHYFETGSENLTWLV